MRTLSAEERHAWLTASGNRRRGPHRFKGKVCHWIYCTQCGLVCLRNDVSRKAADALCQWEE